MADHAPDSTDLLLGAAAGLAAGAIGAVAMTAFQSLLGQAGITSGVRGRPSTERAADRLAREVFGRRLSRGRREVAGEAVHYAVGAAVGGAYGVGVELQPLLAAGRGTAFGAAAATLVDETLVPALGLGDPPTKAPLQSHPYSYASHAVFGVATETARRALRGFLGQVRAGAEAVRRGAARVRLEVSGPGRSRTLTLAFLLGATAGPRTTAPLLAASWAARLGWLDLHDTPLAFLASPKAVTVTTPLALGELVADKLPSTPNRTEPGGVAARVTSAALSGAALAGGRWWPAAAAAAAGSLAATWLGFTLRRRLSEAAGHDAPVAVSEDLLAFGGAALVCLAALAPDDIDA